MPSEDGIRLSELVAEKVVLTLNTRSRPIRMAIVDAKTNEVAVYDGGDYFPEPEIAFVNGSGMEGGTACRAGYIVVNQALEIASTKLGCCVAPFILGVSIQENKEARDKLVAEAKSRYSPPRNTEDGKKTIRAMVEKRITDGAKRKIALSVLDLFCFNGQLDMFQLLIRAYEQSKFEQALDMITGAYRAHWAYQAPEKRGDPLVLPINAEIREQIYKKLNIRKTP